MHIYPGSFLCVYRWVNVDFCQQHDPGEDQWGYEHASERWSPVHTVTTIVSDHRLKCGDEDRCFPVDERDLAPVLRSSGL